MFKGFAFFFRTSMKYDKKYFIDMVLKQLVLACGAVAAVVLPRYLLNAVFYEDKDMKQLLFPLLLSIGIPVITTACSEILENHIFLHRIHVYNKFNQFMSEKILKADYVFVEQESFIELRKKAEKYLYGDYRGFGAVFENMVTASGQGIIFLAAAVIISTMHPVFLVLFAGLAAAESWLQGRIRKKNYEVSLRQVPLENRMSYLNDVVANFEYGKELRINSMGDWLGGRLKKQIETMMGFYSEIAKNNDRISILTAFVMLIQQGSVYAYLISRILMGNMGIGDFTMYLAALGTFTAALQNLTVSLVDVRQYGSYYTYLEQYLNLSGMGENPDGPVISMHHPHEIRFENVSFSYPGQSEPALKNISLSVRQGEKIAVAGENGAGKTTLMKLLTRLYEADTGTITIDGKNINEVNYQSLMKLFAVVYQDFKLFSFTLKENIALAESEHTSDETIEHYIRQFGLSSRVETLKNGIHTNVFQNFDEEGFQPSGGEAQKIAICRAAFKDADIVILDEPTAALDPKAEDEIYRQFDEIAGGRTTFYITHRLTSTQFCDRILVLKDGEICEAGSHAALMERGGVYAQLYRLQAKYYEKASGCNQDEEHA